MRTLFTVVAVSVAVFTAIGARPGAGDATMFFPAEPANCFYCYNGCNGSPSNHKTSDYGATEGYKNGPHSTCYAVSSCESHPTCGGGGAFVDEEIYQKLLDDFGKARRGDLEAVKRLATTYGGYTQFSAEESIIYVRGCGKWSVVGLLRLEGKALALVEAVDAPIEFAWGG